MGSTFVIVKTDCIVKPMDRFTALNVTLSLYSPINRAFLTPITAIVLWTLTPCRDFRTLLRMDHGSMSPLTGGLVQGPWWRVVTTGQC